MDMHDTIGRASGPAVGVRRTYPILGTRDDHAGAGLDQSGAWRHRSHTRAL
jgi:hypothetical protein